MSIIETQFENNNVQGDPQDVAGLAQKILNVVADVGYVEKSGRNDFHRYDYVTENDLLDAVRPGLAEQGVTVITGTSQQTVVETENKKGDPEFLTIVTTVHTFIDTETGAQITTYSQGQGTDPGDKGAYKAVTGANKYFLYKTFMIAAGDDPEGDASTDKRRSGGGGRSSRNSRRGGGGRSAKSGKSSGGSSKYIGKSDRKRLLKKAKKEFGLTVSDVQEVLKEKGIEGTNKIPKSKAKDVFGWLKESAE
ncbi:DNA single-strand annealing protein [Salinibacter phage M8CRM-1]|uniref:DNA single-strand annealing protein n=1 Tax=Salinibacter phage M8CRM-1 TaxID=2681612 RepID=A0A2I6UGT2_9CAUD|nr:DNA single-strand annealing protein [Salinibacter phage M8CRM-1]AUO79126.1 DNA single-strand annealing protein [Salinibacter phage M8CRM-1]